jgi:hypothetical protein
MPILEMFGWLAAALVFTAFWSTTMVRLRMVAMASNVAFITYGVLLGSQSIVVLHGLLLPLNGWKLIQLRQLAALVRRASRGPMTLSMLVPAMKQQRFGAGATLFREGDPADHVLYIIDGTLRMVEGGTVLGPGELVGEMGLFAADSRRTATIVTETDVLCGRIAADRFWELFLQDPMLGGFVVRTIVQRLAGTPHTTPS